MQSFKRLLWTLLMACSVLCVLPALAETELFMAEGVVRKLDLENRKITIKHGEIKNLEMPGMTMVFRLQEKINIDNLKSGDKVLFHVEKLEGGYTITELQLAP
jgi:Cu(I)/Ag(I) efflux system periplasmic protein CusF